MPDGYARWHSNDPAFCSLCSLDTNHAEQHANGTGQSTNSKEELYPSYILDFHLSIRAHGFPIEVAIWSCGVRIRMSVEFSGINQGAILLGFGSGP